MSSQCPTCGGEYGRLAMHWNRSECEYRSFDQRQQNLIQGLPMGDADLHGLSDPNPHLRVRMTNREFLDHLDRRFGILSKGVFHARSAEKQYQTAVTNKRDGMEGFDVVNKENYNALYGIRTCSHPELNEFRRWYQNGEKRFRTTCRSHHPRVVPGTFVMGG